MEYALTADDIKKLSAMDAEQRYDYTINAIVDLEEVWILADDNGFVLMTAEDQNCIPVWPHAEIAQLWVSGDWANCQPHAVDLATWLDKWTPGLHNDEMMVAVFPSPNAPDFLVSPEELAETILEASHDDTEH